jgi:hypothetical protein
MENESQTNTPDNNQPTTPQRQTTPPIFDAKQKEHVNKIIDRVTHKLEAKHREELAKAQAERDAAAGGTLEESTLVAQLRQERDAAQQRLRAMEHARSEAVAASAFTKAWRAAGLPDDEQMKADMRALYTRIGDDGTAYVVDADGRERHGVDLSQVMSEVQEKYASTGGAAIPSDPRGSNARPKTKADFPSFREKSAFIREYGLAKWEALPATSSTGTTAADDPSRWSNEEKGAYLRKHGQVALGERLREAREKTNRSYFKG